MAPLPPPQHLTFKVNGFWEEKPEGRCQALELYCSQLDHSVPVSLGPRADPFLGWDLDMGLSWILQVFVPLATESQIANVGINSEVQGNTYSNQDKFVYSDFLQIFLETRFFMECLVILKKSTTENNP